MNEALFKKLLTPPTLLLLFVTPLLALGWTILNPSVEKIVVCIALTIFPIYTIGMSRWHRLETPWMCLSAFLPSIVTLIYCFSRLLDSYSIQIAAVTGLTATHVSAILVTAYYLPRIKLLPLNLKEGQNIGDFVFEDHEGNPVTRKDLGDVPMLFFFFRGNWCPFCSAHLKQLILNYKLVEDTGVRLIFVSSQPQEQMLKLAKEHGLRFTFLRDTDLKFAKDHGLVEPGGVPIGFSAYGEDTILPTLVFIDHRGKVLLIQRTDNVRHRPDPRAFLEKINQLGMNAFLEEQISARTRELEQEKEKAEGLLLNILPAHTAMELKATGKTQARFYEMVTIIYVDFVGFSRIAATLKPQELLNALNTYFLAYDKAVRASGLEKIKTIGDAYLVVAGVPQRRDDHALAASKLALEFLRIHRELEQARQGETIFQCRIGLHSGPVMAGVAGELKFCYDVWGDTVNLAARMEAAAETGTINLSKATRKALGDNADVISRGKVKVKNHSDQEMFRLEGLLTDPDQLPASFDT